MNTKQTITTEVTWISLAMLMLLMLTTFTYAENNASPEGDSPYRRGLTMITPAEQWREGLPSGNGTIGALVYGGVSAERVVFNHNELWYRGRVTDIPDMSAELPVVRKLLLEGEYWQANDHYRTKMREKKFAGSNGTYHPAFDLHLNMNVEHLFEDYSRTLDFETGEVEVSWKDGDVSYSRRLFVSIPDGISVMSIKGDKKGSVSGGGLQVAFGDTGSGVIRKSAVFNVLAEETGSAEAAWYAKTICASDRRSLWDIIFPITTVEPALPEMRSRHFRTIDYVVMRSSFTDTETVTLACKAGRHTDPHHGHLDCGDWIVHWRGESYIRGIGNIPYDEKCFDDVRWTYPQAGSQEQNVIFINGEKQIPGKWRGKPMDESIGGDVLEYRYGDDREYVLMDGTNAYPKQELKGWRRHFILDKPVVTVVLDEIKTAPGALIESRIHPRGEVEVPEDHAYLLLKGRSGTMAMITATDAAVKYVPDRHSFRAEQKNARLRLIPYVDTELNATAAETIISTIVLPVADETEARAVAESVERSVGNDGDLTLSFTAKGRTHTYRYQRSDDGLVLAQ